MISWQLALGLFLTMKTIKNSNEVRLSRIKIQWDIILKCIKYSKFIILASAAKQCLRQTFFFCTRIPFVFKKEEALKELEVEIEDRIMSMKMDIAYFIKTLVGNRNIYIDNQFWFSRHDLKLGYVLLYRSPRYIVPEYVLFLSKVIDSFDGSTYWPGDILEFRKVNHVLSSVKGYTEKELGIGINYASYKELIKELSILQSEIKSIKNESNKFKGKK